MAPAAGGRPQVTSPPRQGRAGQGRAVPPGSPGAPPGCSVPVAEQPPPVARGRLREEGGRLGAAVSGGASGRGSAARQGGGSPLSPLYRRSLSAPHPPGLQQPPPGRGRGRLREAGSAPAPAPAGRRKGPSRQRSSAAPGGRRRENRAAAAALAVAFPPSPQWASGSWCCGCWRRRGWCAVSEPRTGGRGYRGVPVPGGCRCPPQPWAARRGAGRGLGGARGGGERGEAPGGTSAAAAGRQSGAAVEGGVGDQERRGESKVCPERARRRLTCGGPVLP